MIVSDWVSKWAEYIPGKIALKEFETGKTLTYKQLNDVANQLVIWLRNEHNISFGDRIAVLAENCLIYTALFVASQKAGFIMVPLNYRLSPRELEYMLTISEPAILFFEKKFSNCLQQDLKPVFPVLSFEPLEKVCTAMVENENYPALPAVDIPEDHPIFLIFTSGSTSFPKGAMYTHRMLFWNNLNTWIRLNITSEDRAISCAPPFHTGSWNVLQNSFMHHGAYTLLMKKFDADAILRVMEEDHHTLFWGVPTMLKMMAESPWFSKVKLEKLRYFVVGGEAMPLPLIDTWHKKGIPVRQGYGLTEVGPNVTSLDHENAIRAL